MGKASSSKKVARAAKAGGSNTPGARRKIGFPAALVAIVVLGVALVVFAQTQRTSGAQPKLGEHWHSAYGIWLCDSYAPPLSDVGQDVAGIHTHDDGLIHIHPFTGNAAGDNATLGVFADQVNLELGEDSFTLPDGTTYATGDDCQGEPGVVQVLKWPAGEFESAPEVLTGDLRGIRFEENGQVYVIAFMKPGSEVPLPESLQGINAPGDLAPGETVPEVEVPGGLETGELGTVPPGSPGAEGLPPGAEGLPPGAEGLPPETGVPPSTAAPGAAPPSSAP